MAGCSKIKDLLAEHFHIGSCIWWKLKQVTITHYHSKHIKSTKNWRIHFLKQVESPNNMVQYNKHYTVQGNTTNIRIQLMACCLFGTNLLSEPLWACLHLDSCKLPLLVRTLRATCCGILTKWELWSLKSLTSGLFVQPFFFETCVTDP